MVHCIYPTRIDWYVTFPCGNRGRGSKRCSFSNRWGQWNWTGCFILSLISSLLAFTWDGNSILPVEWTWKSLGGVWVYSLGPYYDHGSTEQLFKLYSREMLIILEKITSFSEVKWQMIILSLIIKRIRVKTLVKDKKAAMEAFGTYVEVRKSLYMELTALLQHFLTFITKKWHKNCVILVLILISSHSHFIKSRYLEMQTTVPFWGRLFEGFVQLYAPVYASICYLYLCIFWFSCNILK